MKRQIFKWLDQYAIGVIIGALMTYVGLSVGLWMCNRGLHPLQLWFE